MTKFTAVVAAAFLSASAPLFGQGVTISDPFSRESPPAAGASTVRGRVTAAESGRPLRDARVSVSAPELITPRVVATDAQGRYELKGLPAGQYTVTGSKETFVAIALGQTRPSGAVQLLALGENQTIENVNLSLPRGGVIAGTVYDEAGEPLIAANVSAMRVVYQRGQRRLVSVTSATTNDLGQYRLFGLSPGSFYVSAAKRFTLPINLVADSGPVYPAALFPGTAHLSDARAVTLKPGQTVGNINISLVPVETASLSGSVEPIRAGVVVRQLGVDVPASTTILSGLNLDTSSTPGRTGDFAISGLAAGEYEVRASVITSGPDAISKFAVQHVALNGVSVNDVRLMMVDMPSGSGRVVIDPAAASALPPALVKIGIVPADPTDTPWSTITITPAADLTFSLRAQPGRMLIRPVLPKGWQLRAVRQNGIDVTDEGVEFKLGEEARDIEIDLTNRPSEISGTARGSRGEGVTDYTAVIFSRDHEDATASSRYFAAASSDRDGRFTVSGLAPGRYYAAAVAGVDPDEAGNPDLIERLRADAVSFTLLDGGASTVDLKVVQ
jgi:hypothetical protein